jgi:hypothetical protein
MLTPADMLNELEALEMSDFSVYNVGILTAIRSDNGSESIAQ